MAIPIFTPIMQSVWANYAPQTALRGASSEAQKQLVARPMDLANGERLVGRNSNAFIENYRADQFGQIVEGPEFRASRRDPPGNSSPVNNYPFYDRFRDRIE